jgi:hypothetical protein
VLWKRCIAAAASAALKLVLKAYRTLGITDPSNGTVLLSVQRRQTVVTPKIKASISRFVFASSPKILRMTSPARMQVNV